MNPEATSWLSRALNLLGIAVVAYSLFAIVDIPLIARVLGVAALVGWLAVLVLPRHSAVPQDIALALMVIAGGIATVPATGLMIVPVAVAIIRTFSRSTRPVWYSLGLALLAILLVAVGALVAPLPALGLVSIEGGVVIAALVGVSRRQFRLAEQQAREIVEEQAHATVLAGRQAIARDLHDLLAHSLGGLVVQLDAIEALLDAGRTTDAATRVHDARALAVAGLSDARRAVGALREDGDLVAVDLSAALTDLVAAHRALGGVVEVDLRGEPHDLDAGASDAVFRLLQEALTNVRRHAPAADASVVVEWTSDALRVVVSNVLAPESTPASLGGGYGVRGMAERFAALPSADFSAAARDGRFVVEAEVRR